MAVDTFRRIREQFLWILGRRAYEHQLERRIRTADPLDGVLENYAALVITDLVRLVDDQQVDRERVLKHVGE